MGKIADFLFRLLGNDKKQEKDIYIRDKNGKPIAYRAMLRDSIEAEKNGEEFVLNKHDKAVLKEMTDEINSELGTKIHYWAEIASFTIHGAGHIMQKYLDRFESEGIKAYLVEQMERDGVESIAEIALVWFQHFRESSEYISAPGESSPAYINIRYDNLFRRQKPRRLKQELMDIVSNPRDAFELPLTTKMLSSWKMKDMEPILHRYFHSELITAEEFGITEDGNYFPSCKTMRRQLLFIAIMSLKYYPTDENVSLLESIADSDDEDVRKAVSKSLAFMEKHRNKLNK